MSLIKNRAFRILASILIIISILSIANYLCKRPNDLVQNTVEGFYDEPRDTLDYVVMGSSAAQAAIFPNIVYKESSFTGYNLSVDGCNASIYNSVLNEILCNQSNAVIIVDLDGFNYISVNEEYRSDSFWIDSMDRNSNWFNTILDCDKSHFTEHIFPILNYHKDVLNYYKLKTSVFGYETSVKALKGAHYLNESRLSVEEMNSLTQIDIVDLNSKPGLNDRIEMLQAFIDYCKANNVKNVVFCDFPKAYNNDNKFQDISTFEKRSISEESIIIESGYKYINFNDSSNECYFTKEDFADSYHLNVQGAKKLSKWISRFLVQNFEVSDRPGELTESWEAATNFAYEKYYLS